MEQHQFVEDDAGRRSRVRALIDHARRLASESGVRDVVGPQAAGRDRGPEFIPGYEVIEELHRGGQGVVYRARQSSTGRTVAIKIMHEGRFGGPRDRARFEREVHILGQLNHPNIVGILDSSTASGSAYFVMDYVQGAALDQWIINASSTRGRVSGSSVGTAFCGDRPAIEATLGVFAKICEAVHVAHLRGVIHRDLKPNNILIDAAGEPRILDFGLAKINDQLSEANGQTGGEGDSSATDHRRLKTDPFTTTGHFVGSLRWASPEQAAGAVNEIDIRTDVYSLGVMLFQSLTGQFPYSVAGNMRDVLDRIMTEAPARPSSICRPLNDDLDTIVLKCLAKEPSRRYQSAGELARDVRHYLNREPIEAKGESLGYLLRKSLARHRAAFLVAAGFAGLITASLVVSIYQWQSTVHQRDRAIVAEGLEKESKIRAAAEAAKAGAVVEFLQNTLASANPFVTDEKDARLSQVLDAAARSLDAGSMGDQPEVEAASRMTLAGAYLAIARSADAARHADAAMALLRDVHPGDDPDVARCLILQFQIQQRMNERVKAERLANEAIDMLRRIHGPDHRDIAHALRLLALPVMDRDQEEAERLTRESLEMLRRIAGEQDDDTAMAKLALARLLQHNAGKRAEARQLLDEAMAVLRIQNGPGRPIEAEALLDFGTLALFDGDLEVAENYLTESLAISRGLLGDDHPDLLDTLGTLEYLYDAQGRFDKSLETCQETLEMSRRLYGVDSLSYQDHLRGVAGALRHLGRDAESEEKYRESLDGLIRIGHDQELSGANTRIMLARAALKRGDAGAAETLAREALAIDVAALPESNQSRTHARCELGRALAAQGRFAEAEPILTEAHRRYQSLRLPNPDEKLEAARFLVELYDAWNAAEPGGGHAEKAAEWRKKLSETPDAPIAAKAE